MHFMTKMANSKKCCFRVDGASDEGLFHDKVQFFWTLEHLHNSAI